MVVVVVVYVWYLDLFAGGVELWHVFQPFQISIYHLSLLPQLRDSFQVLNGVF